MITVYHGTNSPINSWDPSRQLSGYYPGFYTSSKLEYAKQHGAKYIYQLSVDESDFYSITSQNSDEVKKQAGRDGFQVFNGSGVGEVEYLKHQGYRGIRRGIEFIIFDPYFYSRRPVLYGESLELEPEVSAKHLAYVLKSSLSEAKAKKQRFDDEDYQFAVNFIKKHGRPDPTEIIFAFWDQQTEQEILDDHQDDEYAADVLSRYDSDIERVTKRATDIKKIRDLQDALHFANIKRESDALLLFGYNESGKRLKESTIVSNGVDDVIADIKTGKVIVDVYLFKDGKGEYVRFSAVGTDQEEYELTGPFIRLREKREPKKREAVWLSDYENDINQLAQFYFAGIAKHVNVWNGSKVKQLKVKQSKLAVESSREEPNVDNIYRQEFGTNHEYDKLLLKYTSSRVRHIIKMVDRHGERNIQPDIYVDGRYAVNIEEFFPATERREAANIQRAIDNMFNEAGYEADSSLQRQDDGYMMVIQLRIGIDDVKELILVMAGVIS